MFNAGFAAYAFFSAQSFPNPVAAVDAFAVLYLPYSLIGPFAGVFIDRWSRRQIIVYGALIRAAMVAVAGFVVLSGQTGIPLYISALAVLAVNRFFLSAVSAGTPHVVSHDKLVMANAVVPTLGTILGFVGGVVGLGVHFISGGGLTGSAAVLWFGGACYLVAGLLGTRMDKNLLGPLEAEKAQGEDDRARRPISAGWSAAWSAGLRHLNQRRKAAYALGAVGVHRALYGTLLVEALLLYRNYFFHGGNGNKALGHVTLLVVASAIGFGLAAVVTPEGVKRVAKDSWIVIWLLDRRPGDARHRPDLQPVRVPAARVRARPVRPVREDLRGHDRPADRRRPVHGPGVLALRHALQRRLRPRPGHRGAVPAGDGQVLRRWC